MNIIAFAVIHAIALEHANAFVERYAFGYQDADAEIWGIGYAKVWASVPA